jgi:multidrug resistance efflux pump
LWPPRKSGPPGVTPERFGRARRFDWAFKVPGYIAALRQVKGADGRLRDIQVGDEISAGAVLAHLRRSDYEASLNSATGQEQSTQGALAASQAQLDQAKADQKKADQDFERAQALYAVKAMTRPDYDAAVARHDSTTAGVQAAIRQIEARQGQLHAAQAEIFSARINLGDTNLIAPMPAVIVEKHVERGDLVAAGTVAFTLDDTHVVKVNFGVPDSMLGHFRMGSPVPVEVEALAGPLRDASRKLPHLRIVSRAFSIFKSLYRTGMAA